VRRALAAAALFVFSAAAAGLAAEGLVRWLRPGLVAGPIPEGSPFWVHDRLLGWFHRPGERGTFSRGEFSHRASINFLGFRDPERALPGPRGEGDPARVLVFGDSFTWGHGVEDEEVFTRLLEESSPGVEFWNMAVSAYSTDQELLLFRKYGRDLHSTLVLVMVSRNDFEGNASSAYSTYPKPVFVEEGGKLALAGVPVPDRGFRLQALEWLRRRSAFINGFAWMLGIEGAKESRPRLDSVGQIDLTLEILRQFSSEAAGAGARFALGLIPSVAHVYFGPVPHLEARRFEAMRGWGRDAGVPVLDLVPCFREAFEGTGLWYHYREDKHWTAEGHRLAAACVKEDLLREKLIPQGF